MPHVTVTIEIDDEDADPSSDTGLTEAAFNDLHDALSGYSITNGPVSSDDKGVPLS